MVANNFLRIRSRYPHHRTTFRECRLPVKCMKFVLNSLYCQLLLLRSLDHWLLQVPGDLQKVSLRRSYSNLSRLSVTFDADRVRFAEIEMIAKHLLAIAKRQVSFNRRIEYFEQNSIHEYYFILYPELNLMCPL